MLGRGDGGGNHIGGMPYQSARMPGRSLMAGFTTVPTATPPARLNDISARRRYRERTLAGQNPDRCEPHRARRGEEKGNARRDWGFVRKQSRRGGSGESKIFASQRYGKAEGCRFAGTIETQACDQAIEGGIAHAGNADKDADEHRADGRVNGGSKHGTWRPTETKVDGGKRHISGPAGGASHRDICSTKRQYLGKPAGLYGEGRFAALEEENMPMNMLVAPRGENSGLKIVLHGCGSGRAHGRNAESSVTG